MYLNLKFLLIMELPELLWHKQNKENLWGDKSKQDHFNFVFGSCMLCITFYFISYLPKILWNYGDLCYLAIVQSNQLWKFIAIHSEWVRYCIMTLQPYYPSDNEGSAIYIFLKLHLNKKKKVFHYTFFLIEDLRKYVPNGCFLSFFILQW